MPSMARNCLVINLDRCIGCYACEVACKMENDVPGPFGDYPHLHQYFLPVMCQQCDDSPCTHVCPTGAMHKDDRGLVWPDERKCIGCGYCTMACPYHAPFIDQHLKKSSKCDGCRAQLDEGLGPVCVEACPVRALEWGDPAELAARHPGVVRSILPLPPEDATWPNLFILPSPAAVLAAQEGGYIANHQEI